MSSPGATARGAWVPPPAPRRITESEIGALARIVHREAGIVISPQKTDFMMARLNRRLTELGLSDFTAYCALIDSPDGVEERRRFVESLTTHTTSFFREGAQYDWLTATGLPALIEAGAGRARDLVIWSAACSIGSELYSALITTALVADGIPGGLRYRGLGTDISRPVLETAARAIYQADEAAGIPRPLRPRFLLSAKDGGDRVRIAPEIRRRADWRLLNLAQRGGQIDVTVDVVFLRNVLIYFDAPTRAQVLGNVLDRLRPGGFLLTGHSETSEARLSGLTVIKPSIYRKE